MSLFLPILLLGFAQPADQPIAPPAPPQMQIQSSSPAASQSQNTPPQRQMQDTSQSGQPGQQVQRFDPLEIYPPSTSDLCYTMRSYYFNRRNDLAPTRDGMSTCESGRDIAKRKAKHDHKAGFVLLNEPAK
jgi:hypothetical protein